jgi:hypothetical protein
MGEPPLVTTTDLKYGFIHGSRSIFRQPDMSLHLNISFIHIQAKPRAREAKKFSYCFYCISFRELAAMFTSLLPPPFELHCRTRTAGSVRK